MPLLTTTKGAWPSEEAAGLHCRHPAEEARKLIAVQLPVPIVIEPHRQISACSSSSLSRKTSGRMLCITAAISLHAWEFLMKPLPFTSALRKTSSHCAAKASLESCRARRELREAKTWRT